MIVGARYCLESYFFALSFFHGTQNDIHSFLFDGDCIFPELNLFGRRLVIDVLLDVRLDLTKSFFQLQSLILIRAVFFCYSLAIQNYVGHLLIELDRDVVVYSEDVFFQNFEGLKVILPRSPNSFKNKVDVVTPRSTVSYLHIDVVHDRRGFCLALDFKVELLDIDFLDVRKELLELFSVRIRNPIDVFKQKLERLRSFFYSLEVQLGSALIRHIWFTKDINLSVDTV